jgi:hypothetical protein
MAEAERQVRANRHSKTWLAVVAGNARARAFYERTGWHDEGPFDYAAATDDGPIAVPCRRYTKAAVNVRSDAGLSDVRGELSWCGQQRFASCTPAGSTTAPG